MRRVDHVVLMEGTVFLRLQKRRRRGAQKEKIDTGKKTATATPGLSAVILRPPARRGRGP